MKKYKLITEMDVVNTIIATTQNWQGCGIVSPSNIAYILGTSRYQVNKFIRALKERNLLIYKSVLIGSEDDFCPPYNGYCFSNKGITEFKDQIETAEQRELQLIEECFS